MTHTKGPWKVDTKRKMVIDGNIREVVPIISEHDGQEFLVAVINAREEYLANTCLIASAPELLEACKAFARVWQNSEDHYDFMKRLLDEGVVREFKQVIFKAEGK